jgi:hypothetical protein
MRGSSFSCAELSYNPFPLVHVQVGDLSSDPEFDRCLWAFCLAKHGLPDDLEKGGIVDLRYVRRPSCFDAMTCASVLLPFWFLGRCHCKHARWTSRLKNDLDAAEDLFMDERSLLQSDYIENPNFYPFKTVAGDSRSYGGSCSAAAAVSNTNVARTLLDRTHIHCLSFFTHPGKMLTHVILIGIYAVTFGTAETDNAAASLADTDVGMVPLIEKYGRAIAEAVRKVKRELLHVNASGDYCVRRFWNVEENCDATPLEVLKAIDKR